MRIQTKRLRLEEISEESIAEIALIFAKPEVNKWNQGMKGLNADNIERGMQRYLYSQKPDCHMAIYLENKVIGFIGTEQNSFDRFYYVELYLDPAYQNKGYGSEALSGFIDHYLKESGIKQIALTIPKHNQRSLALYKKFKKKAEEHDIELKLVQNVFGYLWSNPEWRRFTCVTCTIGLAWLWYKFSSIVPELYGPDSPELAADLSKLKPF